MLDMLNSFCSIEPSLVWTRHQTCKLFGLLWSSITARICLNLPHLHKLHAVTYLIDLIGQLGQDGDSYDAVFNAVL